MRWESLFADLEAQAEAQDRRAFEAEVADLARAERAVVALVDRLRAHRGAVLGLRFLDGGALRAAVEDVGADCLLVRGVDAAAGGRALVPIGALLALEGLGQGADAGATSSERRLGLAAALRRITRDRAPLRLDLKDGASLTGTADRVGSDHLDLAVHPQDVARHPRSVTAVVVVPFSAVLRVVLL